MAALLSGRKLRARRARGATIALLGVLVLYAGVHTGAAGEPEVAADPVNPVRPVAPADAEADPGHHFLVLVEGDAGLYQNESEGTVLVGGDVRWRGYQVAPHSAPYTVPGDDAPAGLVVLGALDFAGSTGGRQTLIVENGTNGYFGGLADATVVRNGGVTYVVQADGSSLPVIEVQRGQSAQSMALDPGFDMPSLFARYRELAAGITRCTATVQLLDGNGADPWPGSGVATIRLAPGQNVLTTTAAELANLPNLDLAPGSAQPGDATLVVTVTDPGDYAWPVPTLGFQGSGVASHILWNLASAGTVTLPAAEADTVWGTVFAPDARLVDHSSANITGNVVVRSLDHGGPAEDGGEIHDVPFASTVTPCDGDTPTTTTTSTTTTSPSTTTTSTTTPVPTSLPTTLPTTTPQTVPAPATPAGGAPPTGPSAGGPGLGATGVPAGPLLICGLTLLAVGCLVLAGTRRQGRRHPSR